MTIVQAQCTWYASFLVAVCGQSGDTRILTIHANLQVQRAKDCERDSGQRAVKPILQAAAADEVQLLSLKSNRLASYQTLHSLVVCCLVLHRVHTSKQSSQPAVYRRTTRWMLLWQT